MSRIAAVCLLVFLASCAAPGQPLVAVPGPAETLAVAVQATPAQPPTAIVAQPTVAPAQAEPASLAESVVLSKWGNGKQVVVPVDPATGDELPGYAPIAGAPLALSPDGATLAMIESTSQMCESYQGGSACRGTADTLHLVDLSTWRDRQTPIAIQTRAWASSLAYSPDGSRLALVLNDREGSFVTLVDAATGEIVARHDLDFRPSLLGYADGGLALVAYGQALGENPGISPPGTPQLQLMDAASLEVEWEQPFPDLLSGDWCLQDCDKEHGQELWAGWTPAVVLSQDGQALYIVHADEDRLTRVHLAARKVNSVTIEPQQSWLEWLLALTAGVAQAKGGMAGAYKQAVLSPDGTRLYVIGQATHSTRDDQGNWQIDQESLGLQMVEVDTGRVLAVHDSDAWNISLTPNGQHLLLTIWYASPWTEVVGAESLETATTIADWLVVPGRRIDGQPILLGSKPGDTQTKAAVIDPATFKVTNSWTADGYDSWLAVP